MSFDENLLDLWIETLTRAKAAGFSMLSSSPVEPLLEVMVDMSLQLKNLLQEGRVTWEARSNKSLKFSQFQVDALANPKVISSEKQRHTAWDPSISFFFQELAQTLILLKTKHQLPKDLYSKGRAAQSSKQKEQHLNKGAVYQFRRRTRLRKKKFSQQ